MEKMEESLLRRQMNPAMITQGDRRLNVNTRNFCMMKRSMSPRVRGISFHKAQDCSLVSFEPFLALVDRRMLTPEIGNLYTEKATKRDLFYVFYKYGRIAQISMKSAYGFVQYHDADACFRALQSEQAIEIKGRKIRKRGQIQDIHIGADKISDLEISKPQKNARNAVATAAGDSLRAGYKRRSRSPDYGRGGPVRGLGSGSGSGGDRYDRSAAFNPFERRARDDYRPMRSPSPRGFRGRDEYRGGRDRSPDRYYRGRSRSPYDRGGRYRSRSPRTRDLDDEADLPMPRRNPGDVPDVQLILVDEVDRYGVAVSFLGRQLIIASRTFVAYIQQTFRDRGLRCDVFQLPRVSLAAVVKRQMVEGVQAVVKIYRKSQNTGKIPLQVFNRSLGVNNIQFDGNILPRHI